MRSVGITRHVDRLGRTVIPAEFRAEMGLKEGDPVEITMESWDGEKVVLVRNPSVDSPIAPHVRALEEAVEKVAPGDRENYRRQMGNIRGMLGL